MTKNIKNIVYKSLLGTFLVCLIFSANLFGQTVNGRFKVIENSDTSYVGKIQIKLAEGSSIIGNTVIRYKFNPNRLSIPENPSEGTDFKIYNFQEGNYISSVSHPSEDVVSINIAKLFGDDISINGEYTDVAEITFSVKNPIESSELQADILQFFTPSSSEMWDIGSWVVSYGGASFEFPELVSPNDGAENVTSSVTLKWRSIEDADSYQLQLSNDESFTNLIYDNSELTDTSQTFTLENSTQYFWRVKYSNNLGSSLFSTKYSFNTIAKDIPQVVLRSPVNDSTVIGTSVMFKWNSVSERDYYQLQVSSDSNFTHITNFLDTLHINEIDVNNLAEGQLYYWRARASIDDAFGKYSDVFYFKTAGKPIVIPSPQLVAPVDNAVNLNKSITFKWNDVSEKDYYQLQVAIDSNFTNIKKFYDTLNINEIEINNFVEGQQYYWRVRASISNLFGEYSTINSFSTIPQDTTKPLLLAPSNTEVELNTTIVFSWKNIDTVDYYQLEIAEDQNFGNIFYINENVTSNEQTVYDFEKGTQYFWRVRFSHTGGNSMYSRVFSFETLAGTPTIPTLLAPLSNSVDLDTDLSFSWENEGFADHYKIEIFTDSGIQNLFYSKDSIHATELTVNNFKKGKPYFWRVRSTNKNGNSAYSAINKFRTRLGEPSILTLLEPMNNSVGLDNLIEFQWNPIDSALYYQIEIAEDSDFRNVTLSSDSVYTNKTLIGNIEEGMQYYWRVKSHNKLGSITISNIFNFSTHISLPDLPVAISPANNEKINSEVSFSWSLIEGAEYYHLEIARDKNFKDVIFTKDTLSVNKITLNDLGEGRMYYWRVKALNNYGNSNFTDESKFTVKIKKPSNLASKIVDDDRISLSWKDNSKVEKIYIVERKIKEENDSSSFIVIDTLAANESSYNDYSIEDDQIYVYRVFSENSVTSSDYSNSTSLISLKE